MRKKKLLSAVLAAMLAVSAPLAVAVNNALSVTASAEETGDDGEDYRYAVNEDGETICIREVNEDGKTICRYDVNEDGETITLSRYWGADSDVVIPAKLDGKSVTTIGKEAFENCKSLTSVTIPDSVTEIRRSAFKDCTSLESVMIPEGVTTIGDYAFLRCESLSDITIPGSVTTIGDYVFGECTSLETIAVAANSKNYSAVNGVLFNKDKTELIWYPAEKKDASYVIPDTVTTIANNAFRDCKLIASITIPDSVTTIGHYAFLGCTSLTDVTIPHGVQSISGQAFGDCKSLTEVTIPQSVHMIEVGCFVGSPIETVYYGGTKAQWMAIMFYMPEKMVWTYVNCFGTAKIVCTDGIINGNDPDTSVPDTSVPTTSEPTTSESTASNPTSEPTISDPTESTVIPGDTDPVSESDSSANEQTVLEATLKNVDSENGLSGEQLDKLLFGDSGWTWEQVEKIVFTSDELFSVQYTAVDGSTKTLGEMPAQRAEDDGIWNTEWTLDASLLSKDKSFVKLIAKDGTADIKATIYIKKGAANPGDSDKTSGSVSNTESNSDNANTGIALAIAPVVLAAGVVTVASKKRK